MSTGPSEYVGNSNQQADFGRPAGYVLTRSIIMENNFHNAGNDNNIGYGNQPSTISADSERHNTALENLVMFNNIAQDTEITGCPTPSCLRSKDAAD